MHKAHPSEHLTHSNRLNNKDIFVVAIPIVLSNITTPLLGLVDTAVLGQLGAAHLIGAAAVGTSIFSMMFWAFGFLRMGTTGLTAQADGTGDQDVVIGTLLRALSIGLGLGLVLLLLQGILNVLAFALYPASQQVEAAAKIYFDIRIWSAPATLANYALLGWFIGLGRAHIAFVLQLLLNGLNIFLDIYFVMVLHLGIEGVALGTVIAEIVAAIAGIGVALKYIGWPGRALPWYRLFDMSALKRAIAVNTDIMIRTLCLLFAFAFLTAQSAGMDDVTLAANAILLGFLHISAYFLDGFAFAAERFVGRSIGAGRRDEFYAAVYLSSVWAGLFSITLAFVFWLGGGFIIDVMTINENVREVARVYLIWAIIAPVVGFASFQLDGIFIGATQTQDMRNMMIVSLVLYLTFWFFVFPIFGNHGLWASLIVFFIVRALTLLWCFPKLEKAVF
ncbi:MAG: MATE family efflux transporter [Pseudomonadota bacterium]